MFGGLITNAVWCGFLIVRNGTAGEFVGRPGKAPDADGRRPPLLLNYLLAAFGGTLWYFQFFFYTMGTVSFGLQFGGQSSERSEEHTPELQSLMRNSYAVFCLKKKQKKTTRKHQPARHE